MSHRFSQTPGTASPCGDALPGIVIHGRRDGKPARPRISAFIWGGKVPSTPVLAYGRRKDAA